MLLTNALSRESKHFFFISFYLLLFNARRPSIEYMKTPQVAVRMTTCATNDLIDRSSVRSRRVYVLCAKNTFVVRSPIDFATSGLAVFYSVFSAQG